MTFKELSWDSITQDVLYFIKSSKDPIESEMLRSQIIRGNTADACKRLKCLYHIAFELSDQPQWKINFNQKIKLSNDVTINGLNLPLASVDNNHSSPRSDTSNAPETNNEDKMKTSTSSKQLVSLTMLERNALWMQEKAEKLKNAKLLKEKYINSTISDLPKTIKHSNISIVRGDSTVSNNTSSDTIAIENIVTKRRSKSLVQQVRDELKHARKTQKNIEKEIGKIKPEESSRAKKKRIAKTAKPSVPKQNNGGGARRSNSFPGIKTNEQERAVEVVVDKENEQEGKQTFKDSLTRLLSSNSLTEDNVSEAVSIFELYGTDIMKAIESKMKTNEVLPPPSLIHERIEQRDVSPELVDEEKDQAQKDKELLDEMRKDRISMIEFKLTSGYGTKWKLQLQDSMEFDLDSSYRKRDKYSDQKGVSFLVGTKYKSFSEEVIAILFDKDHFSEEKAEEWFYRHDHRFFGLDGKIRSGMFDSLNRIRG